MTASQQPTSGESVPPGTGFPTDDTNRQADSSSTGHDKAVKLVAQVIDDVQGENDGWRMWDEEATAILAALRAALAAGDADVAEAFDVPALLATAKAQALRDAADEWQQGDWIMVLPASLGPKVIGLGQRVTDWLRARADRAEA